MYKGWLRRHQKLVVGCISFPIVSKEQVDSLNAYTCSKVVTHGNLLLQCGDPHTLNIQRYKVEYGGSGQCIDRIPRVNQNITQYGSKYKDRWWTALLKVEKLMTILIMFMAGSYYW